MIPAILPTHQANIAGDNQTKIVRSIASGYQSVTVCRVAHSTPHDSKPLPQAAMLTFIL